jgi:diguanylate cyclase
VTSDVPRRSRVRDVERSVNSGLRELSWPLEGLLVESMPDGVFVVDREGRIVFSNPQAEKMTGYTRTQLDGQPIELLVPPRLRAIHKRHRQGYHDSRVGPRPMGTVERDFPVRRKDGSEFSADIALAPVETPTGRQTIAVIRDITQRKQLESALEELALHDPLTGLANRTLFFDRLHQAMQARHRDQRQLALVMLDVDQFKAVNDAYGHLVGDQVLRRLAHRLTAPLRTSDTVARLGGDEFAWILPGVTGRESALRMVSKLLTKVGRLTVGPQRIQVGVSAGLALYPHDGQDVDTLLSHADLALYSAKRQGAGRSAGLLALNQVAGDRTSSASPSEMPLHPGQLEQYQPDKHERTKRDASVEHGSK